MVSPEAPDGPIIRFVCIVLGTRVVMTDHGTALLPAALDRVERAEALDQAVARVEEVVRRIPEGVRRKLKGVDWLGHPLHPALVHLPLGAWMAAGVMDAKRRPEAARSLIVLGVASALPAAAAGWSDWAELNAGQKRTGLVHAVANNLGVLLYVGSIVTRYAGRDRVGRKLGLAGLAAVGLGGAIGGDLAYRRAWAAGGANHVERAES